MACQPPGIDQLLAWDFPLIPLGRRSKCPVAKGWNERRFARWELGRGNLGTRLGESVDVDGRHGTLFVIDFDSDDLSTLKALCAAYGLPRSTCVRSGGQHHGYHLFYLVEGPVRKAGGLVYDGAHIDLLGSGSFVVLPPSVVEHPYRYLVGFEELADLPRATFDTLREELRRPRRPVTTTPRGDMA